MARHKKKQSRQSRDKLADAHRRNEFFFKLNYLVTALTGDPSVFRLIPQSEYRRIFLLRMRAVRVAVDKDCAMPQPDFNFVNHFLISSLKTNTVVFTSGGPKITLDMFFTVGMSLFLYLGILTENEYPTAKVLINALKAVTAETNQKGEREVANIILDELETVNKIIPNMLNDFRNMIYWVELYIESETAFYPVAYYQYKIYSYRPKIMHMVVDGISRPAYELCFGDWYKGLVKLKIHSQRLGISGKEYPELLPVFIQTHAIYRLYERMDCARGFMFWSSVIQSMLEVKYCKGPHNTILFDFVLLSKKVGYLVASIQQGVVLIQSFLLITNSGTPEGDRLASATKLKKPDKEYLSIDKLSAFYASDIPDNPEVKKLFIDAGCTDLFDLDPYYMQKGSLDQKKPLADKIRAYLNYTRADEDMETYRKEQMPG